MNQSTDITQLPMGLKIRPDDFSVQENADVATYRKANRAALLDLIEARWPQISSPPSAQEIENWITVGRGGER